MKDTYVVRKTTKEGKVFYLNPNYGFGTEDCGGGVYAFPNNQRAKTALEHANKFSYGYDDTVKDDILTYDEYVTARLLKLDEMEKYAKERGIETYFENGRLYLYLVSQQFGKMVASWYDVTLKDIGCIDKILSDENKCFN